MYFVLYNFFGERNVKAWGRKHSGSGIGLDWKAQLRIGQRMENLLGGQYIARIQKLV